MISDVFKEAVELVLELEGEEYTETDSHPTKYGITQHTFPAIDVTFLTRDEAIGLYYEYFWVPYCDAIAQEAPRLSTVFFTVVVNMGLHSATKCLQASINQLGRERIEEDGIFGPITMAHTKCHGNTIVVPLLAESVSVYFRIAHKNQKNRRFLRGWINRILKVLDWYWRKDDVHND